MLTGVSKRFDRLFDKVPFDCKKVADLLFYAAFAMYSCRCILARVSVLPSFEQPAVVILDIVEVPIVLVLLGSFLFRHIPLEKWAVPALLAIAGFVCWRVSGEGWLFWLTLFVICGKEADLKRLAKVTAIVSLAGILAVVVLFSMGFLRDYPLVTSDYVRHSVGFSHPNTLGIYLVILCMSISVIRFGKNPLPDIAFLALASWINLAISHSRSPVVLAVLQAVFLLVFHYVRNERARDILRKVFAGAIVLTVVTSFVFMFFYDASNPLHAAMNSALSGRLRLAHDYFNLGSITLFGNNYESYEIITWYGSEPMKFLVDNAYCHLLLRFGLVFTGLFFAGGYLLIRKVLQEKRWDALLFGLVIMAIFGFSETCGIRVECNYFLVMVAPLVLYGDIIPAEGMSE